MKIDSFSIHANSPVVTSVVVLEVVGVVVFIRAVMFNAPEHMVFVLSSLGEERGVIDYIRPRVKAAGVTNSRKQFPTRRTAMAL